MCGCGEIILISFLILSLLLSCAGLIGSGIAYDIIITSLGFLYQTECTSNVVYLPGNNTLNGLQYINTTTGVTSSGNTTCWIDICIPFTEVDVDGTLLHCPTTGNGTPLNTGTLTYLTYPTPQRVSIMGMIGFSVLIVVSIVALIITSQLLGIRGRQV